VRRLDGKEYRCDLRLPENNAGSITGIGRRFGPASSGPDEAGWAGRLVPDVTDNTAVSALLSFSPGRRFPR